jgi:hypothetical protein
MDDGGRHVNTPKKSGRLHEKKQKLIGDRVFDLMCQGNSSEDIAAALNIPDEEFAELRAKILLEKGEALRRKTPEVIYAEYVADTKHTMSILGEAITSMHGQLKSDPKAAGRVGPALVSAIKLRQDTLGEMIKTGQSLGIIDRQQTEVKIGGIVIAGVPDSAIRKYIADEMVEFGRLQKGAINIEAIEIGPIHYGEPGVPDAIQADPGADNVDPEE